MAWWAQKIGSYAETGNAVFVPPTQTCTALCTFSSALEKSRNVRVLLMIERIVVARGRSSGASGSRTVRGRATVPARAPGALRFRLRTSVLLRVRMSLACNGLAGLVVVSVYAWGSPMVWD